jgi:predicted transcriptional regulator
MARPPITKARPYTPQSGAFKGRTFHTERDYRNEIAKRKGFASWHEQQRAATKVTPKSFGELRPSQKQARARALDALSKVRHGETLTRAAREAGTTPNTVARYAGGNLHREGGRTIASRSDRLFRVMNVGTTEGVVEVPLRSSRQASLVGEHANAVKKFLLSGDDEPLRKFAGVKVAGRELEVRPEVLEELQRTGELEYEPYEK